MKRLVVKKDRSNVLTKTFKIEVVFSENDSLIIDGQSKICNWIYNKVLSDTIDDYKNNENKLKLTSGYNSRDYFVRQIKPQNLFTKSVYAMVAADASTRVKTSFKQFFERKCIGFPKFNSWKEKWFSLNYEKPNSQGIKIINKNITFTLGKNENGKQMFVTGELKNKIKYKNFKLNTVVLTKKRFKSGDKFFVSFSCDIIKKREQTVDKTKWCSIDPNHKNMFVMLDYNLNTVEFSTIKGIKQLDKQIDKVISKIDVCKIDVCRKQTIKKIKDKNGKYIETIITPSSNRHKRLSKSLDRLRNKRREQIKQMLYTIANFLCKKYDYIMIGDYTPSTDVADTKHKTRSMLNQTFIGKFRQILKQVCLKSYKICEIIDEKGTTAKCSHCGDYKKKDPSVRFFTCPICGTTFNRDINSDINIAKKGGIELNLSGTDYLTLNKVKYNVSVNRRIYVSELKKLTKNIKTTNRGREVGKSILNRFK